VQFGLDDDHIPSIDFRFFEIGHELGSLQDYFRTTERQLPLLAEHAEEQLFEELTDEDTFGAVRSFAHRFAEDVLPRFFRSPILVALWAIYESGTTDIAEYLRQRGNHALKLQDISGRNELDRKRKYFEHILKFQLITDERAQEYIEMLLLLRNSIAHGNGHKDFVKENNWNKINSWERHIKGVSTEYGYLTFSESFIGEMLNIVGDSLNDLIQRVKALK
jgi:hypothetical protein